jgi:hypothetical protein
VAFIDAEKDEWKNDGRRYLKVLPGFVELEVKMEGRGWRWTVSEKRRPLESATATSVTEAMTAAKESAKKRSSK